MTKELNFGRMREEMHQAAKKAAEHGYSSKEELQRTLYFVLSPYVSKDAFTFHWRVRQTERNWVMKADIVRNGIKFVLTCHYFKYRPGYCSKGMYLYDTSVSLAVEGKNG